MSTGWRLKEAAEGSVLDQGNDTVKITLTEIKTKTEDQEEHDHLQEIGIKSIKRLVTQSNRGKMYIVTCFLTHAVHVVGCICTQTSAQDHMKWP